jgi:hypothetical protein
MISALSFSSLKAGRLKVFRRFPVGNLPGKLAIIMIVSCVSGLAILDAVNSPKAWAQQFNTAEYFYTGRSNPYILPHYFFRQPIKKEKGLQVGPVTLHPHLGLAQIYSDNVLKDRFDRISDVSTHVAPGIQAYMPFKDRHSLLLDVRADQSFYSRTPQNDALQLEALGRFSSTFSGGLSIDLQGGHTKGFDARGSALDLQLTDITTWNTNFFYGHLEYLGPTFGAELYVRTMQWNFENNEQDIPRDRVESSIGFTTFVRTVRKAYALVGIELETSRFDHNKQLDSFIVTLSSGFRLLVTDHLSGEVRAGISALTFDRAMLDEPPDDPRLDMGGESQRLFFATGRLDWNPTSRSMVSFLLRRSIRQAAVFNVATFVQTTAVVTAKHQLTDRLGILGNVTYMYNDFGETFGRIDQLYKTRLGVSYRATRWLGFRLEYRYLQRASGLERFGFYSNDIMLSVQAML